jgi:large subunit ribosomal protein L29
MKYTDLKNKELNELQTLLKEKQLELFSLRIKKQMSQQKNTAQIRLLRKDVARINTAMSSLREVL